MKTSTDKTEVNIMKTAFITGATSGIGFEFAKSLSEQGYRLIVHGRNPKKLAELERQIEGVSQTICADLSDPATHAQVIQQLEAYSSPIDVAINNAGYGLYGAHIEHTSAQIQQMVSVNVLALTSLSEYFARRMEKQGKGYLMNVASTAAYQPQPYMAAYAASKAYVASFTEALAVEMKGKGVNITCLSPGRTDTGFFTFDGKDESSSGTGTFAAKYRVSPAKVAQKGLDALFKGRFREIPFLDNKFYVFLNRILSKDGMLKMYSSAMKNV
ncbi:SDR family oxidoreductase [Vibrio penaeicida]|uniref:SDR family NAD(P)-dependent oxidoreductase n=1 Tax=Vibrio penaeicida TaxID=104609 RepID=UPI002732FF2C|nr:SDR family oxidoreductase [Vibrio penaeicida]MDP2571810.1 SDR family oxidoreductase [Vibrio penaeicida]